MDEKTKNLLIDLEDEIDRKCYMIKEKKKEAKYQKIIFLSCILLITIPFILAILGINIVVICIPVILFLMFSIIIISPVIFN